MRVPCDAVLLFVRIWPFVGRVLIRVPALNCVSIRLRSDRKITDAGTGIGIGQSRKNRERSQPK